MALLKKFLFAFAIALYSVAPVFAEDGDRIRNYWQWQGAKMLKLKVGQQTAWAYHLKKAHLECVQASAQDLQLMKERLQITSPRSASGKGLIAHYKSKYQIAVGRNLTQHQRPLMDVPSHRFRRGQSKCSGMRWDKGSGKNWGQGHGKSSNKRYGMGGDKGAGERGDRSRGDKWQKYRKKKSFDSD